MATARKLSRLRDHREQLYRNLLTSLVLNGRIITTSAKAKAVKPLAEKIIVWGRSTKLADQRRAASYMTTNAAAAKLMKMVKDVPSVTGAIRLVRTTPRLGDNAPQIALIIRLKPVEAEKPKTAKARPAVKPPVKKTTEPTEATQ